MLVLGLGTRQLPWYCMSIVWQSSKIHETSNILCEKVVGYIGFEGNSGVKCKGLTIRENVIVLCLGYYVIRVLNIG